MNSRPDDLEHRLNVGCGHDVRSGWINLDSKVLPGVDVVQDLGDLPVPFEDGHFSVIDCQDVLEHVDLVPVMREMHRILAPGGYLHIRSPHFSSSMAWMDPTHRRAFSVQSFEYFVAGSEIDRNYYFDFSFEAIEQAKITFWATTKQPWNNLVQRIVNRSPRAQRAYETTMLVNLFPALNVDVTLKR